MSKYLEVAKILAVRSIDEIKKGVPGEMEGFRKQGRQKHLKGVLFNNQRQTAISQCIFCQRITIEACTI